MKHLKVHGCAVALLSVMAFSSGASAQDPFRSTCQDVKKWITSISQVAEWGAFWDCRAPDKAAAEVEATLACVTLLAEGSQFVIPNTWLIKNWVQIGIVPIPLPDTYLGYCVGTYAPGATARSTPDPSKAAEAKKKVEAALEALRKKN